MSRTRLLFALEGPPALFSENTGHCIEHCSIIPEGGSWRESAGRHTYETVRSDVDTYAEAQWKEAIAEFFHEEIRKASDPACTVVALTGLMDLYDFLHVSQLMESLLGTFPGYLLVFFPGEREGNTYRFLDARVGWDYLGVPILSER